MLRIKILEALYTNPMKMIDFNEYMHVKWQLNQSSHIIFWNTVWEGGISFKHCLFIHCDSQSPCHTVLQDVTGEKTQTEACSHPH